MQYFFQNQGKIKNKKTSTITRLSHPDEPAKSSDQLATQLAQKGTKGTPEAKLLFHQNGICYTAAICPLIYMHRLQQTGTKASW